MLQLRQKVGLKLKAGKSRDGPEKGFYEECASGREFYHS